MTQGSKPIISVFCSAARPKYWLELHENLSTSEVPFEMVFVGNKKPKFILPSNFHFIYSNVKPSQCYYIAAHYCQGEFLFYIIDDFVFSDNILDQMLKSHSDELLTTPEFLITSPRYLKCKIQTIGMKKDSFPQALGMFMNKSLFDTIGIDNNFIAQFWDLDTQRQIYQLGGKVNIFPDATVNEKNTSNLSRSKKGFKDMHLYYSLWHDTSKIEIGGDPLPERRIPVQPFCWTDDILTVSQGRTNVRWD